MPTTKKKCCCATCTGCNLGGDAASYLAVVDTAITMCTGCRTYTGGEYKINEATIPAGTQWCLERGVPAGLSIGDLCHWGVVDSTTLSGAQNSGVGCPDHDDPESELVVYASSPANLFMSVRFRDSGSSWPASAIQLFQASLSSTSDCVARTYTNLFTAACPATGLTGGRLGVVTLTPGCESLP